MGRRLYNFQIGSPKDGNGWPPVITVEGDEIEGSGGVYTVKRKGEEVAHLSYVAAWWLTDL